MTKVVHEIIKYKGFLHELILRDFKKKYYKSVLGVLWTLLYPLLFMAIKTIIFSTLFSRDIQNFPVYMLSGWLIYNFFSDATNQGMYAIVSNSELIKKIYLPPYVFCISTTTLALINTLISMLSLFIIMAVTGTSFKWTILLVPFLLVMVYFFALGISLVLSVMGAYFRDLFYLYGIVLMAWFFLTPIFYPIEIVPAAYRIFWDYNPLLHFVNIKRDLVLLGVLPDPATIIYALSYSALAMGLGITMYSKLERNLILHI